MPNRMRNINTTKDTVLVRAHLPVGVHADLVTSAKRNQRSLHGEMIFALTHYAADVSAPTPIDKYMSERGA